MNSLNSPLALSLRPMPVPDASTSAYWKAAAEHRLVIPRCDDCARFHFYPRTLCPYCGSARLMWAAVSGRGRVYSVTVLYQGPSPAFKEDLPYALAIVELEEGPSLMSNIVGCDPLSVKIGMSVEVAFRDCGKAALPVFRPA
jgi:uncharacterized OB-fold protein